jgi:molybdenum cofactor biosynthesis enzyme MoaA
VPKDSFNREIDYLRLSVTDRCNLRCVYCMPLEGLRFLPNAELIAPAEYEMVARAAVSVGFRKFRLTGGEPLLRLDILEIVERLARVPGVQGLALTTNALLLPELAGPLKKAGLGRINVHLDSLNPETVERQMRWGSFDKIWNGIMAAEAAGLTPIKLNAVVTAGFNEADVMDLARLTIERDWHVRFIELMPLGGGECARLSVARYVSNIETRRRIETALGPLSARRDRIHQPGQRAVLRDLQSHAADGRRQVPSLLAERRRAGREEGDSVGRGRHREGCGDPGTSSEDEADRASLVGGSLDPRSLDVPDRRLASRLRNRLAENSAFQCSL